MVRGGILRKSLESTKYECKLQGIPDQFLSSGICTDMERVLLGLTQETRLKSISDLSIPERFVFVNSSMCLTCLLPGFDHSCIWGFDGNAMNMRLLASVAWTRNNQQGYYLHRFCEKWWQHASSNKDGETMRESDLPKQRNKKIRNNFRP